MRDRRLCDGPAFGKCLTCAHHHYGTLKGTTILAGERIAQGFEERVVDFYVPVSEAVARGNQLRERRLPFKMLPNFVPDDVASTPAGAGVDEYLRALPPSGDYVLYVGEVSEHKGVKVLLDAYQRLHNAPPLVLIGRRSPTMTAPIPPNVLPWPYPAMMAARRAGSLALAPSVWPDPCPTVVMEAMAAGQAVIATTMGGLPEIVANGETGLLLPPGDPGALAGAIQRLIDNAEERRVMGEAGLRRVRLFQASTVIPKFEDLYRELLDGRRPEGQRVRQGSGAGR
jgi:glycosyltransferase involved in cell wall biosynthesis